MLSHISDTSADLAERLWKRAGESAIAELVTANSVKLPVRESLTREGARMLCFTDLVRDTSDDVIMGN